jgi:hypothetical protein
MDVTLGACYILRETLGIVGMGVALLWSAGQIDWWPAWASLAAPICQSGAWNLDWRFHAPGDELAFSFCLCEHTQAMVGHYSGESCWFWLWLL